MSCGPGIAKAVAGPDDVVSKDCEVVTGLPKPGASIADAQVAEGNSGPATLSFAVSLDKASTQSASVGYADVGRHGHGRKRLRGGERQGDVRSGRDEQDGERHGQRRRGDRAGRNADRTLSGPRTRRSRRALRAGTITNDDKSPHAGHYSGQTSQGKAISFDVSADSTSLSNMSFSADLTCPNQSAIVRDFPVQLDGSNSLTNGAFSGTFSGSSSDGNLQVSGSLAGSFDPSTGAGSGTLQVDLTVNDPSLQCSSGQVTWTAN